jgi:uncharacterized damage-inducible protein DinB
MANWQAPERTDPPLTGPERPGLEAWLDYHRATLVMKCAGLDGEQLARRACPPSTLSLLGLVRHMVEVENSWFATFDGSPWQPAYSSQTNRDGEFDDVDPQRADDDLTRYLAACEASRRMAAAHDLDDVTREPDVPNAPSLRWIMVHMIEEYARHNGHADLLRQAVDGTTGE